jgi:hypothetical protein
MATRVSRWLPLIRISRFKYDLVEITGLTGDSLIPEKTRSPEAAHDQKEEHAARNASLLALII